MGWDTTVEEVKDLCYQCEFRQVLDTVDCLQGDRMNIENYFDLQLIKSQALFEMHLVSSSRALLRDLAYLQDNQSDKYLYVIGKLSYLDQNYQESENSFRLLSERSESVRDYFKAILGLANIYHSLRRHQDIKHLLLEMEELSDLVTLDEKLSFALLKANSYYQTDGWFLDSKKIFHDVIHLSANRKWSYFLVKAHYGLANLYKCAGKLESLEVTIDLLKCYLKTDEAVYLTYLVNEKFKDQNFFINSPLQFDTNYKRISVQGKWIPLHDKPLIYRFLEFLHGVGIFVNKKQIAEHLWPNQPYRQKKHDPRIFDLARRVRMLIEPYENQPICLLSGRFGYRLASPGLSSCESTSSYLNREESHA